MIGLEEELSKRTNELQNTRSEASARSLLTHTRLSQCEEELKITNESIIQAREANSILQRRCEELAQKLDDQRNHELTMHASYKEEIAAQTRLADLYKGMADEANSKADDYSNAVKELQDLLEHATEQYGILESKYNQVIINHNQEIGDRQKNIDELTKELNLANELLKTIKQGKIIIKNFF
jgi:nucleoprotein TPR